MKKLLFSFTFMSALSMSCLGMDSVDAQLNLSDLQIRIDSLVEMLADIDQRTANTVYRRRAHNSPQPPILEHESGITVIHDTLERTLSSLEVYCQTSEELEVLMLIPWRLDLLRSPQAENDPFHARMVTMGFTLSAKLLLYTLQKRRDPSRAAWDYRSLSATSESHVMLSSALSRIHELIRDLIVSEQTIAPLWKAHCENPSYALPSLPRPAIFDSVKYEMYHILQTLAEHGTQARDLEDSALIRWRLDGTHVWQDFWSEWADTVGILLHIQTCISRLQSRPISSASVSAASTTSAAHGSGAHAHKSAPFARHGAYYSPPHAYADPSTAYDERYRAHDRRIEHGRLALRGERIGYYHDEPRFTAHELAALPDLLRAIARPESIVILALVLYIIFNT